MEAQLDSPQQGQLGASVGGLDNVRQDYIAHRDRGSLNAKPSTSYFALISSVTRCPFSVTCPAPRAGCASVAFNCSSLATPVHLY